MARKLPKIIAIGVALIMSLGLFVGCGGNKYNATILDNFPAKFKDEFLKTKFDIENEPEKSDEWWGDTDIGDGWWNYDQNGKKLINAALIIKNQSEADIAFDDFPLDFDFEKEMLIFCFFAEPSQWIEPPSSYKLKDMRIDDLTLKFIIEIKAVESSAQGRFNQKCITIKMKKLDVTKAKFTKSIRP